MRAEGSFVAGVDEVGRGAWAGPMSVGVALVGAAQLSLDCPPPRSLRDSKELSEKRREELFSPVSRWCAAWSVGHAEAHEVDDLGVTGALQVAFLRAMHGLPPGFEPGALLLDGGFDFVSPVLGAISPAAPMPVTAAQGTVEVQTVIKGDASCISIAAAALVAKVTRDREMRRLALEYPGYGLEKHKGYPTAAHREAVARLGMTPIHRLSWRQPAQAPSGGPAPSRR